MYYGKEGNWERKLQLPAGKTFPAPPIGPALGRAASTCGIRQGFQRQTADKVGMIIRCYHSIRDRSFSFILKTPPASILIKKAAGKEKGSSVPNKDKVGKITKKQVQEIAALKMPDLNANDIDAAMKMIEGTARSMGIEVVG